VKTYLEKASAEDVVATLSGVVGITNVRAVVPSEAIDDQIIANDIITALDRNAMIDAGHVDVNAENGVITFNGSVPSSATQRAAFTIAWYTRGVRDVRNNLVIDKKKED
jgi:osmotically-inducible protein OsmY